MNPPSPQASHPQTHQTPHFLGRLVDTFSSSSPPSDVLQTPRDTEPFILASSSGSSLMGGRPRYLSSKTGQNPKTLHFRGSSHELYSIPPTPAFVIPLNSSTSSDQKITPEKFEQARQQVLLLLKSEASHPENTNTDPSMESTPRRPMEAPQSSEIAGSTRSLVNFSDGFSPKSWVNNLLPSVKDADSSSAGLLPSPAFASLSTPSSAQKGMMERFMEHNGVATVESDSDSDVDSHKVQSLLLHHSRQERGNTPDPDMAAAAAVLASVHSSPARLPLMPATTGGDGNSRIKLDEIAGSQERKNILKEQQVVRDVFSTPDFMNVSPQPKRMRDVFSQDTPSVKKLRRSSPPSDRRLSRVSSTDSLRAPSFCDSSPAISDEHVQIQFPLLSQDNEHPASAPDYHDYAESEEEFSEPESPGFSRSLSSPPTRTASRSKRKANSGSADANKKKRKHKSVNGVTSGGAPISTEKPTWSYAALIGQAIFSTHNRRISLADIYAYIMTNYPFYRKEDAGWQNSIRHNLSLNDCFIKTARTVDNPGKGALWTIVEGCEEQFADGGFTKRLANGKKKKLGASASVPIIRSETTAAPRNNHLSRRKTAPIIKSPIPSRGSSPAIAVIESEPRKPTRHSARESRRKTHSAFVPTPESDDDYSDSPPVVQPTKKTEGRDNARHNREMTPPNLNSAEKQVADNMLTLSSRKLRESHSRPKHGVLQGVHETPCQDGDDKLKGRYHKLAELSLVPSPPTNVFNHLSAPYKPRNYTSATDYKRALALLASPEPSGIMAIRPGELKLSSPKALFEGNKENPFLPAPHIFPSGSRQSKGEASVDLADPFIPSTRSLTTYSVVDEEPSSSESDKRIIPSTPPAASPTRVSLLSTPFRRSTPKVGASPSVGGQWKWNDPCGPHAEVDAELERFKHPRESVLSTPFTPKLWSPGY